MVVGIVCIVGVGLVDAYFIGQLGPDALAAVSFLFPVTTALSSLGVGVMVGVNSVISRALGADHVEKAECRAAQGVVFAGAVGVVIALTLYLSGETLFTVMNASPELRSIIAEYVGPFTLGFPFLLVAMGANGALRGQGEAVKSSSMLIIIAVVNAVLDPILIFGWGPAPALGVAGAAWAVAIAYAVSSLLAIWLLAGSALRFDVRRCLGGGVLNGVRDIARVGVPAAVANAVNPAGLAALTAIAASHGDAVVAAFGAAGRLQAFAVVPLLALSSSIGPIVGQNWGAGEFDRARQALRLSAMACVGYGLAVALPLVVLSEQVGSLFSQDQRVIAAMASYLLIAAGGFFAYGLLVVANGALNAIGHSATALAVSVARVLVVMLPLGLIGSVTLGPQGVFGADLAANLIGGTAAMWLGLRAIARGNRGDQT